MRREAKLAPAALGWLLVGLIAAAGCNLSDEECLKVRTEAFDIINESHVCGDDSDCYRTEWPGCGKPVSSKNLARLDPLQEKFDTGGCKEEPADCRNAPEVYCKQGLCVLRELKAMPTSE